MSAVLAALRLLGAAVAVLAAVTSVFWAAVVSQGLQPAPGPPGLWTTVSLVVMGLAITGAGALLPALWPRKAPAPCGCPCGCPGPGRRDGDGVVCDPCRMNIHREVTWTSTC